MSRPLLILAGAISVHLIACRVAVSAWWVPDLTLVMTVLIVAASPGRWWLVSGAAGLVMMCWTVPFPAAVLVWYLALGGAVSWLSRNWDVTDVRVQCLVVGVADALWLALHLWLQAAAPLPLLALAAGHVSLTVLVVPVGRRLISSRRLGLATGEFS